MATFVSKPVEINATQFRGVHDSDIEAFGQGALKRVWVGPGGAVYEDASLVSPGKDHKPAYEIETLEGKMLCRDTDWVIVGTEGEVYPCKDSVFQRKYSPATEGVNDDGSKAV